MGRGFALTLVVVLVGACGLTGSDRQEDVLHEEDAAELARYSAQLLVRNEPAVQYASAHFYFEDGECSVPLEDAEVIVNGTPLPGEISATACGHFSYGEVVRPRSDGRFLFTVRFRSSRVTYELALEPVQILEPAQGQEIAADEPFAVAWDRPIDGAEVLVSNSQASCVYTRYAHEVEPQSATFTPLELSGSAPCSAALTLRYAEDEDLAPPFRGGILGHRSEQALPIVLTR